MDLSKEILKIIDLKIDVLKERLSGMDKALELKTDDMDRRLAQLNELRSEVVQDRSRLVQKETYDIKTNYYDSWILDVIKRLVFIETSLGVLDSKMEGLNQLRKEVIIDRELFVRKENYDLKVSFYDQFVIDLRNRVTIIETRLVVWGSSIIALFALVQAALHFFLK